MTIIYGNEELTINNLFNNIEITKIDEVKRKLEMYNRFEIISFDIKEIVLKVNISAPEDKRFPSDLDFMKALANDPGDFDRIKRNITTLFRDEVKTAYDIFFNSDYLINKDEKGIVYFTKKNEWFYMDYELFKKELKEIYAEIFKFLEVRALLFSLETEEKYYLIEKLPDYDEYWSDTFIQAVPKKEKMIELKSLDIFK